MGTLGSWLYGTAVIQAQPDRLVAYDLATGRVRWTYRIPEHQAVCMLSRFAEAGVGLVGYTADHGRTCTELAAVGLSDGRVLWDVRLADPPPQGRMPRRAKHLPFEVTAEAVTASGGVVAVAARDSLRGFGLRDGDQLWRRPADEGCDFQDVVAAAGQVLAQVGCSGGRTALRSVDTATGETRWEAAMPSPNATLLSAAPPAVLLEPGERRGSGEVISYDGNGRTRTAIPFDGLRTGVFDASGTGPALAPMVEGDRLVAVVGTSLRGTQVQAYDLARGRLLWSTGVPDVRAVRTEPDRVLVLGKSLELYALSLQDGEKTRLGAVSFLGLDFGASLLAAAGRYVIVPVAGTEFSAPVAAFSSE